MTPRRRAEARLRRPVAGDAVTPRTVTTRKLRTVEAGPNAPLLMRLVRHPFALGTVRPKRVAMPARETGPLRSLDHRPEVRPRPFARVRRIREDVP